MESGTNTAEADNTAPIAKANKHFLSIMMPPLGVAPGCTMHPVISGPPWGDLLTSAAFHLQRLNEILQGLPAKYFGMFLDF
ncbi:hypothetical protein PPUN12996_34580 [Pseudomonas putida]|nr:hypothetical protein PPUN12996_34580 [Pseudomonas putida]